jgi:hypothetical protein
MNEADAAELAQTLGLRPSGRKLWKGRRDGLAYRLDATQGTSVWLYCAHKRSLRLGLHVQRFPTFGVPDLLAGRPHDDLVGTDLSASVRVRASEPETAHAIVLESWSELVPLLALPHLAIDDRRVGALLGQIWTEEDARLLAARMKLLSSRLCTLRLEWETEWETAIEPIWSEAAT